MIEFVCDIPGASASTAAWHAAITFGLTAIVLAAGTIFLVAALVAFRRPVASRSDRQPRLR